MIDDHYDVQMQTRELRVTDTELTGAVRWFSEEKGYGFIEPDDGSEDVFVRHSSIEREGFRSLEAGQRVAFSRTSDGRGPRAVTVRAL